MKTFAIALAAAVAASASAFQAGECPNNPTQYDCVPGYELFWLGFNVVSGGTKSIVNGTIKTLEPIFAAPTFSKVRAILGAGGAPLGCALGRDVGGRAPNHPAQHLLLPTLHLLPVPPI